MLFNRASRAGAGTSATFLMLRASETTPAAAQETRRITIRVTQFSGWHFRFSILVFIERRLSAEAADKNVFPDVGDAYGRLEK